MTFFQQMNSLVCEYGDFTFTVSRHGAQDKTRQYSFSCEASVLQDGGGAKTISLPVRAAARRRPRKGEPDLPGVSAEFLEDMPEAKAAVEELLARTASMLDHYEQVRISVAIPLAADAEVNDLMVGITPRLDGISILDETYNVCTNCERLDRTFMNHLSDVLYACRLNASTPKHNDLVEMALKRSVETGNPDGRFTLDMEFAPVPSFLNDPDRYVGIRTLEFNGENLTSAYHLPFFRSNNDVYQILHSVREFRNSFPSDSRLLFHFEGRENDISMTMSGPNDKTASYGYSYRGTPQQFFNNLCLAAHRADSFRIGMDKEVIGYCLPPRADDKPLDALLCFCKDHGVAVVRDVRSYAVGSIPKQEREAISEALSRIGVRYVNNAPDMGATRSVNETAYQARHYESFKGIAFSKDFHMAVEDIQEDRQWENRQLILGNDAMEMGHLFGLVGTALKNPEHFGLALDSPVSMKFAFPTSDIMYSYESLQGRLKAQTGISKPEDIMAFCGEVTRKTTFFAPETSAVLVSETIKKMDKTKTEGKKASDIVAEAVKEFAYKNGRGK